VDVVENGLGEGVGDLEDEVEELLSLTGVRLDDGLGHETQAHQRGEAGLGKAFLLEVALREEGGHDAATGE
jgi:hypothetical protein